MKFLLFFIFTPNIIHGFIEKKYLIYKGAYLCGDMLSYLLLLLFLVLVGR